MQNILSGARMTRPPAARQGGIPAELTPGRPYKDTWQVVEQAAAAGLVLTKVPGPGR
jgi:hypothetical protein